MSCFFHFCTLLVALALLSFFIQLAPAQSSPPPCNLSLPSAELKVRIDDDHTLTLFKDLSLSLPTDHSTSSFTFTFTVITSNADEDITSSDEHEALTSLAFILMRGASAGMQPPMISMQSKELRLMTYKINETRDQPGPPHKFSLDVCINAQTSQFQMLATSCTYSHQNSDHSDETEVSLSYDADAKQIHGQAVHYSHAPSKLIINQIFSFNTSNYDESNAEIRTTLFVGYITSGNATINVSRVAYLDDGKSNHKMVVVWVTVGVSVMLFLIGLLILVLFITSKRRGRRPRPSTLVRSHPAASRHGTSLPSAPPFSHHDLESTVTPMMKALPLSPPHNSAFHISGTASWLKQPNPR